MNQIKIMQLKLKVLLAFIGVKNQKKVKIIKKKNKKMKMNIKTQLNKENLRKNKRKQNN